MASANRKVKNFIIISFLNNTISSIVDDTAEIKNYSHGTLSGRFLPFEEGRLYNNIVAQGILECTFGKFIVKLRPIIEGALLKNRDRKMWIKLKNIPIFCWDIGSIGRIIKGFGDVVMLDDLTQNFRQDVEVVQIACV